MNTESQDKSIGLLERGAGLVGDAGITCDPDGNLVAGSAIVFTGGSSNTIYGCGAGDFLNPATTTGTVLVGFKAGQSSNSNAVAIGNSAGNQTQGGNAVAIGLNAGSASQSSNTVAVGNAAGYASQGQYAVAVGIQAGQAQQGGTAVAVGFDAGQVSQGMGAVAIGRNTGMILQGVNGVAIGAFAGNTAQGGQAVAIGQGAGQVRQGSLAVAIGLNAGNSLQGNSSVSIGTTAGQTNQGRSSVAIGTTAGNINQGDNSLAIGVYAGATNQGQASVAIGINAGANTQGGGAVAIGNSAGRFSQGGMAVAIGTAAGQTSQSSNSIVINASGTNFPVTNSGFYIAPIRTGEGNTQGALVYNTSSNEITFNAAKTFVIQHPVNNGKYLVHACLEGPEAGVYYRGNSQIEDGNDRVMITLPNYVHDLATDFTVHVTSIFNGNPKARVVMTSGVENGQFTVFGEPGPFYWIVYGMRETVDVEPNKSDVELKGDGPYKWIQ